MILKWLSSQPFTNVLLILIVTFLLSGAYYVVDKAMPAQAKVIQDGYDRMQERQSADIERIVTSYEKTLDIVVSKNND